MTLECSGPYDEGFLLWIVPLSSVVTGISEIGCFYNVIARGTEKLFRYCLEGL